MSLYSEQTWYSVYDSVSVVQNALQGTVLYQEAPASQSSDNQSPSHAITQYLLREVPEFWRLSKLRQKGWENPEGDQFFEKQRKTADNADKKTAKHFFRMMKNIGHDMHQMTDVFFINGLNSDKQAILDMCVAPGGFLATALRINPQARAIGFSLPKSEGGHNVLLPKHHNVSLKFLDITMLAADMGRLDIPNGHPDAGKFLPRQFSSEQRFDLVICDGQVLRTHERATYREHREARRLTLTQLALGLEHVKLGGTMIVLLHKVESPDVVRLLHAFTAFASVRLYKHPRFHAMRSSFYMLATNIRNDGPEAAMAIQGWKKIWDAATFGTDDMYHQTLHEYSVDIDLLLRDFGPRLAMLGKHDWSIQADALAKSPFVRHSALSNGAPNI
ncbi:FtsJ-like methyltransferase family protein [Aspergillus indologenus CBS 114.80]|uniref:FtsJ-like methyltransferase family protein n=1 Tax=Aspergillus indologenus CBS 114.80 TaxID=1450541 RepID=A0A2V5II94_9EURO|nr:FtsJ-like methyltransferase family protein [Aspergillus indologenus CBS 114.80]